MSYTITQQPDIYNLSAMVNDFIIESDANIVFELRNLGELDNILQESYTPDSAGKIYIRDIGKFLDNYLGGDDFETMTHSSLFKSFSLWIDGVYVSYFCILKCKMYTNIDTAEFVDGNVFLNLLKRTKRISTTSPEYLTCKLSNDISAFVTSMVNGKPVNSTEVILNNSKNNSYTTLDVSFTTISKLFPAIPADTILALRIRNKKQIAVLLVDRANYLLPLNFVFKNYFDVPETLVIRGNVTRKGATSYDTAKINRVKTKYNVVRDDAFDVDSGKIYSLDDYDRYREMFDSEDVRLNFKGKLLKVIITEENSDRSIRSGNLQPISFTFQFADVRDNNYLLADAFIRWILESGVYEDDKMWVDSGHMLPMEG